MSTQDSEELLAAWALDAVDEEERSRIESAMALDPALAEQARRYREAAADLAGAVAQAPPPELRDTVLTAIADLPQAGKGQNDEQQAPEDVAPQTGSAAAEESADGGHEVTDLSSARERRRGRPLLWAAAAAAAVIAIGAPTTIAVQQHQRAVVAEQQAAQIAELLAEPDARLMTAEAQGGGRVQLVAGGDRALVVAADMPPLDPSQGYQLWTIEGDEPPRSAGMLPVEDGAGHSGLDALPPGTVVAITVEPAQGSEEPTSDPIVAMES